MSPLSRVILILIALLTKSHEPPSKCQGSVSILGFRHANSVWGEIQFLVLVQEQHATGVPVHCHYVRKDSGLKALLQDPLSCSFHRGRLWDC